MKHPFEDYLFDFYEYLLLEPLSIIYTARKETKVEDFQNFSNLIIDKFAIHSASFFHLSKGIIELKQSTETVRISGYDLFSVNTVFRTMIENYATFNHLFVEPRSVEEQKFRFLLWKIDGLFEKQKFEIMETDFLQAKSIIDSDKKILDLAIRDFENCELYSQLSKDQIKKIYKPETRKFSWRFLLDGDKIVPLKITELVKHTCRTRDFINNYRYTSIHTHTNYLALEHFEQTRGKPISEEYTNPNIKLAIYLTSMLISDICSIDSNAEKAFEKLPKVVQEYITKITTEIKNENANS